MAEQLPRDVVIKWRAFAATPEFTTGINYLKETQAPSVKGKSPQELMEAGLKWGAYFEALNDIMDVLCKIEQAPDSLEDKGLE
jgi:hypothetical protein